MKRGWADAARACGSAKACLTAKKADAMEGVWGRQPPEDKPTHAEGRMLTRAEGGAR